MLLGRPLKPSKGYEISKIEKIVSLDNLSYAASLENLAPIENDPRHFFQKGDICDRELVTKLVIEHEIEGIVNFAAESHVDRSIQSAKEFVLSNVLGTTTLLDVAVGKKLRYVQVSTDEVYGSLGDEGTFVETMPIEPNSPYSASKAAADCFVRAYHETHKLPCVITRCSNNYGPFQYPEKFLPLSITNLLRGRKIPLYGTGKNVRDWIHVEDHAYGVYLALTKGSYNASVYNFGGFGETSNIEMAQELLGLLAKKEDSIQYVEDRKGHDWRYSMDSSKAQRELGWKPKWELQEGLKAMVDWFKSNPAWWESKVS